MILRLLVVSRSIFPSDRASIENRTFIQFWIDLAKDYFNNEEWKPQNLFGPESNDACSYCFEVDPSTPSLTPWTPEQLRDSHNDLKRQLSKLHDNVNRSGDVANFQCRNSLSNFFNSSGSSNGNLILSNT